MKPSNLTSESIIFPPFPVNSLLNCNIENGTQITSVQPTQAFHKINPAGQYHQIKHLRIASLRAILVTISFLEVTTILTSNTIASFCFFMNFMEMKVYSIFFFGSFFSQHYD